MFEDNDENVSSELSVKKTVNLTSKMEESEVITGINDNAPLESSACKDQERDTKIKEVGEEDNENAPLESSTDTKIKEVGEEDNENAPLESSACNDQETDTKIKEVGDEDNGVENLKNINSTSKNSEVSIHNENEKEQNITESEIESTNLGDQVKEDEDALMREIESQLEKRNDSDSEDRELCIAKLSDHEENELLNSDGNDENDGYLDKLEGKSDENVTETVGNELGVDNGVREKEENEENKLIENEKDIDENLDDDTLKNENLDENKLKNKNLDENTSKNVNSDDNIFKNENLDEKFLNLDENTFKNDTPTLEEQIAINSVFLKEEIDLDPVGDEVFENENEYAEEENRDIEMEENRDIEMKYAENVNKSDDDMGMDANDEINQERNTRGGDSGDSFVTDSGNIEQDDSDDRIIIEDCLNEIKRNNGRSLNFIKEGAAEILLSSTKNVFYNPVQEFNRDISVAALTVFSEDHQKDPQYKKRGIKRKASDDEESESHNVNKENEPTLVPGKQVENGMTILEALSATGLRSIRYAKEVPGVKKIIANDLSSAAVETIQKNIEHNEVSDLVVTTKSDAALLMYQHQANGEWYDAIDVDPYGCPSRFLDSAVQAVRDGGMLLVTCTDMAVLAGNSPETCHAKYGAVSLRNSACHEMAIRIALQCIESHANRYGRYIVPLLSISADFYIRVIVLVYTSPVTCKKTTSKLSMVYQCVGCHALTLHPLGVATQVGSNNQVKFSLPAAPPVNTNCSHCGFKHHMGGPIWTGPIHSIKFVERMLTLAENTNFNTKKRMEGMLEVIREELLDVPLYYTAAGLCSKIHCSTVPLISIKSALLNAGYRVSLSHANPTSIKTNAPVKVLWDIIRCWVRLHPVSMKRMTDGSVAAAILCRPPTLLADFTEHHKARPSSRIRGLLRFQQNPQRNWGPGTRARSNCRRDEAEEKRRSNQNKRSKNDRRRGNIDIIEVVTLSTDEDEGSNQP